MGCGWSLTACGVYQQIVHLFSRVASVLLQVICMNKLIVFVMCGGTLCARLCLSQERHPGDRKNYNECIRHENMRVAVCDMLDGKIPCPEALW